MVDSTSNAPLLLPLDQRVHTDLPFRTRFSSSWSAITGNLGRLFSVRRFDPKSHRSNESSSTRRVRIPSEESSSGKILEAGRLPEHLQPSVEKATQSSSRLYAGLLSDSIPHSNEGMPRSQEYGPSTNVYVVPNECPCSNF